MWQQHTDSIVAILDTACQRSVCGQRWLSKAPPHIPMLSRPEKETFRFGVGQDISSQRLAIAASLDDKCAHPQFTVHVSLVAADVPYLWSRQSMEAAGLVIDLAASQACFTHLP
eukprot:832315-Amphidinium_carterae.1